MSTVTGFFGEGDVLPDPRDVARQGSRTNARASSAAPGGGTAAAASVDPSTSSVEGSGVYWSPMEYSPSWLGAIFNPLGRDGRWETAPGSFADQYIRRTPEYKDAHKACMVYLKSGPIYQENAALHKQHGTLDEYHHTLENSAHDYAQRTCINDHWHIGENVGNPQYTVDNPQPPGYVSMRQRIEQAYAGKYAGKEARPSSQTEAGQYAFLPEGTHLDAATVEQAKDAALRVVREIAQHVQHDAAHASANASVRRLLVDKGLGEDEISVGTAWCVAPGKFVTCRHVVEGGRAFGLDEDGHSLDASPTGVSETTDAAIVDCPESTATPLPVGPDPVPGDHVTMAGFAYGEYQEFHGTVVEVCPATGTDGALLPTLPDGAKIVRIEGAGAPGESGGPCFVNGRVAGHVVGGDPSIGEVYVIPASEIVPEMSAQRTTQPVTEQASGAGQYAYRVGDSSTSDRPIPPAVAAAAQRVAQLDYTSSDTGGGTVWPIASAGGDTVYAGCAHSVPGDECGKVGNQGGGKVLTADRLHDCAAISVPGQHQPLPLASEDAPPGTECYILGYPVTRAEEDANQCTSERQLTITPAVVRGYGGLDPKAPMSVDGYACGGNSGGPIVDREGRVIGLYTSGRAGDDPYGPGYDDGTGIPVSQIRESLGIGADRSAEKASATDAAPSKAHRVGGTNAGRVSSVGVGVGVGDGCYYPGFYPGLGYPMGPGVGVGVGVGETFAVPFSTTLSPTEIGCAEASSVNGEARSWSYVSEGGEHAIQWTDADASPTPLADHGTDIDVTREADVSAEPQPEPVPQRHETAYDSGPSADY